MRPGPDCPSQSGSATRHAALALGIGLDDARVGREAFPSHQAFSHAALKNALKQVPKGTAVAKATMPVLRERGVIRYRLLQPQMAEPAVSQIQVNLFAQAPFGANSETVADDEHADHQLGINGGTPRVAVVFGQAPAQSVQIEEAFNATQQMLLGNVVLEVEGIEQLPMITGLLPHHHCTSASICNMHILPLSS